MNHARLIKSARLQRVEKVLSDGRWHSSWEVTQRAKVVAVGTCISELRANGARIDTEQRIDGPELRRVWFYRMTKKAKLDG